MLTTRGALRRVACDAVSIFIASFTALLTRSHAIGLFPAIACTVLWALFVFNLLGLYRQSYAVFRRDEFYYSVIAVAFASAPLLVLLLVIPHLRDFFPTLAIAFAIAVLLMGAGRFLILALPGTLATAAIAQHTPHSAASLSLPKRIIDVTLAGVAAAIFLPVMIVAMALIYLESGRPIFFYQERIGLGGRVFSIVKFRTMQTQAGSEWARPGDTRITRLGRSLRRFSIDELPQLFNVLQGDMSIVGPRPEMRSFATRFRQIFAFYDERHRVRPGLTGWAQVYMKRNLEPTDAGAVLLHDLFYVRHCSIYLDLVLICKTAAEFLFHRAV